MSALATIGIKGKDGKYKDFTISISDFTNDYGQNVSMYEEQSKEEREQKVPKKYIGNGKVFWTDGKITKAEPHINNQRQKQSESTQKVDEDLPF